MLQDRHPRSIRAIWRRRRSDKGITTDGSREEEDSEEEAEVARLKLETFSPFSLSLFGLKLANEHVHLSLLQQYYLCEYLRPSQPQVGSARTGSEGTKADRTRQAHRSEEGAE